jgi:CRP/FNR family cyclic AMP-dependent transcriptional regulator
MRREQFFCDLSDRALQRLNAVKSTAIYPKRAHLFNQGEAAYGVFVLCTGRVKLSTCSHEGKAIITKICQSGDVLGLNAVVSNRPYEVMAEMMECGRASFIPRDSLLQFMREHGEVAKGVAEQLSSNYYSAHEEVRALGLTMDPAERLAKLLLSWSSKTTENQGDKSSVLTLTHQEIGETIGVTRQTVTRVLSQFRKNEVLQVNGLTLSVCNRRALEKIVQF